MIYGPSVLGIDAFLFLSVSEYLGQQVKLVVDRALQSTEEPELETMFIQQ